MSEEIVTFGSTRSLVGVLHRPKPGARRPGLPSVVLLNAGILHRVGPNRLYVTMARRLAERGFNVLRFDVFGIGDSQEHQEHAGGAEGNKTFVDDTLEAFELLRERVGASRFMLMGICMGAQISLEVARRDRRVDSLVLMEGIYVKSVRYHVSRLLDVQKWKRVATGQSHMVKQVKDRVLGRLGTMLGRGPAPAKKAEPAGSGKLVMFLDKNREKNMKEALRSLLQRGAKIMLVFRDGNEIAHNYRLRRTGDRISARGLPAGMDVEFVPFADHTFTPLASQELLLEATKRWIDGVHLRLQASA